jgi:hypothetical protein
MRKEIDLSRWFGEEFPLRARRPRVKGERH